MSIIFLFKSPHADELHYTEQKKHFNLILLLLSPIFWKKYFDHKIPITNYIYIFKKHENYFYLRFLPYAILMTPSPPPSSNPSLAPLLALRFSPKMPKIHPTRRKDHNCKSYWKLRPYIRWFYVANVWRETTKKEVKNANEKSLVVRIVRLGE